MTQFTDLGLPEVLLRALESAGYKQPSPIQAQAIPPLLQGRDLLGIAQTGTGKTAAFALPILNRILAERKRTPGAARVLVLAPTRELAAQIAESFREYGQHMRPPLQVGVVVGGVSHRPQAEMLARGVEVLVATPGRLLDHLSTRRTLLAHTEVLVLDEADHMLDLGFIVPIRRIVAMLPRARQTLLFSATMPKEIAGLAGDLLRDPAQVSVAPVATTAEKVEQRVVFVDAAAKRDVLTEILRDASVTRAIVFTRTKHGADRVAQHLEKAGVVSQAIHGNKSQNQRVRALDGFRNGTTRVLVATDIAARGIDVDAISHVVNFELPDVAESYVHRIGRTARAGASGEAISLCDNSERQLLRQIERLTRQTLPFTDRRSPPGTRVEAAPEARTERPRHHGGGGGRGAEAAKSRGPAPRAGGHPGRAPGGQPQHAANAGPRSDRASRFRGR